VAFVNQPFLDAFALKADEAAGASFAELGDGQWDIPELTARLTELSPGGEAIEGFAVAREFPRVGYRSLLINARAFTADGDASIHRLIAIEDVTDSGVKEAHDHLVRHLDEVNHRVKNNIATISAMVGLEGLSLKGREVSAAFARISRRLQAFSSLYATLAFSSDRNMVILGDYLDELGETLQDMVDPRQGTVRIAIEATPAAVRIDRAAQIGAIVNELVGDAVVNLSRAKTKGSIDIRFAQNGGGYELTVSDDGPLPEPDAPTLRRPSLGQQIVSMYIDSLGGKATRQSDGMGTRVSITLPAGIVA
jgi:chemotaxis protein methyltransferase CheR